LGIFKGDADTKMAQPPDSMQQGKDAVRVPGLARLEGMEMPPHLQLMIAAAFPMPATLIVQI
jgi:hypothetical protein